MTLVHASRETYNPGDVVCANGLVGRNKSNTEAAFEKARPTDAQSRLGALFACATLAECAVYASAEPNGWLYYEVAMTSFTKAPMALVNRAHTLLNKNQCAAKVLAEYWAPKENWLFYEFVGPQLTIVQQVPALSSVMISGAKLTYGRDVTRAAKLFP